jgi:hypothetical protein
MITYTIFNQINIVYNVIIWSIFNHIMTVLPKLYLCTQFEPKPVTFCTTDNTTYVRLLWPILLLHVLNKF